MNLYRRTLVALGLTTLLSNFSLASQGPDKVFRIGFLGVSAASLIPSLIQRLRELGYAEGKNLAFEFRNWGERPERISELTAELVRAKVDLIVAFGSLSVAAAKRATVTIPIVMIYAGDPVALGYVPSLARPGGNVTGLTWDPDVAIVGKAIEILKESIPNAKRIALLWNVGDHSQEYYKGKLEQAATRLRIQLVSLGVRSRDDLGDAFRRATAERAEGLMVFPDHLTIANHLQIDKLAAHHRLPMLVGAWGFGFDGALLFYGPKISGQERRAADYVARILNGALPGDLPIEQPTILELVINLNAAKALGLTIPQSVLLRADRVIE